MLELGKLFERLQFINDSFTTFVEEIFGQKKCNYYCCRQMFKMK